MRFPIVHTMKRSIFPSQLVRSSLVLGGGETSKTVKCRDKTRPAVRGKGKIIILPLISKFFSDACLVNIYKQSFSGKV